MLIVLVCSVCEEHSDLTCQSSRPGGSKLGCLHSGTPCSEKLQPDKKKKRIQDYESRSYIHIC